MISSPLRLQIANRGLKTHFIHSSRKLFSVVKRVQRRFDIRQIRCTLPVFSGSSVFHTAKRKVFDYALRNIYPSASPDCWCEFRTFYKVLAETGLPNMRCLELLLHPGSGNATYIEETKDLKSDWRELLPVNVHLGSYRSLDTFAHTDW